jgi:ATP-dependent helicase/nuclease subunit A
MTNSHNQQSNQPIRLQDAQSDIRDAYFNHQKGLFTLPCVAGAGKSLTGSRIAAENVLQRYVDGDPTPEQHIAIIGTSQTSQESTARTPRKSQFLYDLTVSFCCYRGVG